MPARSVHVILILLFGLTASAPAQRSPIGYAIDLTDRADDRFKVTAWVGGLTADNAVYQFAATAPGTYQVMDIGRFVRSFEAFDAAGKPVSGDLTSLIRLYDAGTEKDELPGAGSNQAPRQKSMNEGPDESGSVRPTDDGFTYPAVNSVIKLIIAPAS